MTDAFPESTVEEALLEWAEDLEYDLLTVPRLHTTNATLQFS